MLGFPSDQFRQNPGTDEETKAFCTSTYQVTFPLFSTIDVNGPAAHPLWAWMCAQRAGVSAIVTGHRQFAVLRRR